jgi:hypothetical protein
MEAKAEFLKAVAVKGTLAALWLDALRVYLPLITAAEEIGGESACACRPFDERWERAFRAWAVSEPLDAHVTSGRGRGRLDCMAVANWPVVSQRQLCHTPYAAARGSTAWQAQSAAGQASNIHSIKIQGRNEGTANG